MGYAVFFSAFALYLSTLAPTVTFWDSGELVLGAYSLGVPHHPGYPVFCMIGKAFSLVPLGGVAYRTNVMSAALASAAVYVLYRLNLRMFGFFGVRAGHVPAAVALLFAVYPAFWAQAVVTEVYALNALIVAGAAYSLVLYHGEGRVSHLYLAGLLVGLAFGNHHSAFFLLPGVFLYLVMDPAVRDDPVRAALFLLFIVLGFSVNLYLPVRAHAGPVLNVGGADELGGLLWLSRWPMYAEAVSNRLHTLPGMLTFGRAAVGIAGLGVVAALVHTARDRRLFSFLAATALTYAVCVRLLAEGDAAAASMGFAAKFYIPAVMLLPPILAAWLPGGRAGRRFAGGYAAWTAAAACLALAVFLGVSGFRDMDNSRNYYARDLCANTLKSVSERAALFAWGDSEVFPAWYLMHVERYRDDVMFMDAPQLTNHWYVRQVIPELGRRYGIVYEMPGDLDALADNVRSLNRLIWGRAGIYFTYTAAHKFKVAVDGLLPQGLVLMLRPDAGGQDPALVWRRLVISGRREDAPRTQVAEDIFAIYGYQAFMWGEEALRRGGRDEAREAYNKAWYLGYRDPAVRMRLEAMGAGM